MSIKLNLAEKFYLVALFGDASEQARRRLFSMASLPAQAGPVVIAEGRQFMDTLGSGTAPKRPRRARWHNPLFEAG